MVMVSVLVSLLRRTNMPILHKFKVQISRKLIRNCYIVKLNTSFMLKDHKRMRNGCD